MMTLRNVYPTLTLYQSEEETVDHVAAKDVQYQIACRLSLAALSFLVGASKKDAGTPRSSAFGNRFIFLILIKGIEKIWENVRNFSKTFTHCIGNAQMCKETSQQILHNRTRRKRQEIRDHEITHRIFGRWRGSQPCNHIEHKRMKSKEKCFMILESTAVLLFKPTLEYLIL